MPMGPHVADIVHRMYVEMARSRESRGTRSPQRNALRENTVDYPSVKNQVNRLDTKIALNAKEYRNRQREILLLSS
jgi:hypothetical protein